MIHNDKNGDSDDPLDTLVDVEERQHEFDRLREENFSAMVAILEHDHRRSRNLRKGIATFTVFVVMFFGALLAYSWLSFPDYSLYEPAAGRLAIRVAIVISPALAITTIMMTLLIGVFHVPKRTVIDDLLSHAGRVGASQGGTGV